MTSLALQVKDEIVELVKNDQLVLPTLPEIALQVRQVAEDENANISDLGQIVARDPALTARIIKVSNSPLVRSNMAATDLNSAISRLGMEYTTNLAVGLAMEQMFQATHDMIDRRLRLCWSHSLEISASAHILAKHFTDISPDQAMLAGLMHQIGMLPILAFAENHSGLLADSISLDFLLERLHPSLGAYILRSWKFSPELVQVAKEYLDFKRDPGSADLTDIIQVATLQSYADSEHPLGRIDRSQVGSFKRLGLSVEEESSDPWADLSDELAASTAALQDS